jgi:hypothetical protein
VTGPGPGERLSGSQLPGDLAVPDIKHRSGQARRGRTGLSTGPKTLSHTINQDQSKRSFSAIPCSSPENLSPMIAFAILAAERFLKDWLRAKKERLNFFKHAGYTST